jgi:prepilin-type N-terminal cleavage/methylation domain-containing protein
MTSTARTSSSRGGFSLIEIVLVLAIASMMLGGAATFMYFSSEEKALKDSFSKIEVLAKRARSIAILHQTPYAIEFRPGVVRLLPLAEAGRDERKKLLGHTIGGEVVQTDDGRGAVHDEINLDSAMTIMILRWNTEKWLPMTEGFAQVWRFDPDGLCEPISVRVSIGKSQIEGSFHPLTAAACDTTMEHK